MEALHIGLIREGKVPPDARVPLAPAQCAYILDKYPVDISVQPSPGRCFSDAEYDEEGLRLTEDLSACDVLMGVKEVPIAQLIPGKTYLFFSHTIKKQSYNRKLLQAILAKDIRLVDYEVLTDEQGQRLIAFGKYAGMVGAHNGIMAYGLRTGRFALKRMKDCRDYKEAQHLYSQLRLPPMKVIVSGGGRVAKGAMQVLHDMGFLQVQPEAFLAESFDVPVFTQLNCQHYAARKDGAAFDKAHFYQHPEAYRSAFAPYAAVGDVFINGIYWDSRAPAFFSKEDMRHDSFALQVIADVTCDIAPDSSIPSTLFASTIAEPIFGYDPLSGRAVPAHSPGCIDMMTVDNLPNELPRDASEAFGEQFIEHVLEELLDMDDSPVIRRATVAAAGQLGPHFQYLQDYVAG